SHFGAQEAHPLYVRPLAAHVLGAHVDDALEPEARADRRRRNAVLARARLRDDPPLAQPPREQRLAKGVVELVRAGVEEVLTLQVEPPAGGEALGEGERRGAAAVVAAETVELVPERVVFPGLPPAGLELVQRRD